MVAIGGAATTSERRAIHSCATHEEIFPAVVVGEVSVGTFAESEAKPALVRSRVCVAPRDAPRVTHPISPCRP
jgi:hypothetical protein